jgi:anti-sigma regulatory factor (Ser/Thr protein kinase)
VVSWFSYDERIDALQRGWRGELLNVLRRFCEAGLADDVLLATSELVSNSLEHGGGLAYIHVRGQGDLIRVEVSDNSPSVPSGSRSVGYERGRGLQIVGALSDEWGWAPTIDGKTMWAEFHRHEHRLGGGTV